MGGNDKQGFGMKQGVLTAQRVFLLMVQKTSGFQGHGRRKGERRRKACRGCIVSPEIAVLNLMIVKQGENPIPGLTDDEKPRMRGPKRASKIRKLFNLSKEDDVRKYVNTYRREFESATGKKKSKAPKISAPRHRQHPPAQAFREEHQEGCHRQEAVRGSGLPQAARAPPQGGSRASLRVSRQAPRVLPRQEGGYRVSATTRRSTRLSDRVVSGWGVTVRSASL